MLKLLLATATLLFAASPACARAAAHAPSAAPDTTGILDRLTRAAIAKRVQMVVDEIRTRPEFVGLSVAVGRRNQIIVDRGVGVADLEWKTAADANSPFRIGSLTKQFTAAAIMRLVEQGKLSLDDPLSKYVPEFDTGGHKVTIRQLLNHTSGIPNYTAQPDFIAKKAPLELTEQEVLKSIAGVPFDFEPGAKWDYSNTNYFLLGMVVEKVSGRSYADFMRETFFKPLALTHTRYGSEAPIIPERARGYSFDRASERRENAAAMGMTIPGGAGGLISTAGDLLRWQIALSNGRAVSPASFQQMIGSTVKIGQGDAQYGFGLMVDRSNGQRRVWHNGGINGFNSVLSWWPDLGLRIAVISNCEGLPSDAVEGRIFAALTSANPPSKPRSAAQPGAEAAVRNLIAGLTSGKPDYAALTPEIAEATRAQLPGLQPALQKLGMLKSIAFKGIDISGADEYLAEFANGGLLFTISLDSDGKIAGVRLMPAAPASAR